MKVTVNGQDIEVDDGTTVDALLARLRLPRKGVAVALNDAVLPRSHWDAPVPAGSQIEVLTAVQGG